MRRPNFFPKPIKTNYEYQEGESIEIKCRRLVENNEPITDGAPIIYTNRDDGIIPAYNIRTDRWEIAQMTMDKVNADRIAKSKQFGVNNEGKEENGSKGDAETLAPGDGGNTSAA